MITEFAKAVGVPQEKILGRSRKVPLPDLRHVYWKLIYDNTHCSFEEVGQLSNRRHPAVIHGIRKVNDALQRGDNRITKIWNAVKDIPDKMHKKTGDSKLENLMADIYDWSDNVFGDGQRNPAILHHLRIEVNELLHAVRRHQDVRFATYSEAYALRENVYQEYAECFMLFLDSASSFGISADELIDATRQKLEVNKKNVRGVSLTKTEL